MPTPLSLFALDEQLAAIEAHLLDEGGETDDETSEQYDALLDAREDKAAAYIALIRRNDATAKAFADEAARLSALAKTHGRAVDRLKGRLLASMLERGEAELVSPIGRVKVQRAGTRAVVLRDADAAALPERFRVVTVSADKRAIADALKAGDAEAEAVATLADAAPFVRIY